MPNRRRKDPHHDVGGSSPGTVGDSSGTIHDGQLTQTITPKIAEEYVRENEQNDHGDEASHRRGKPPSKENAPLTSYISRDESMKVKYYEKYGEKWSQSLSEEDFRRKEAEIAKIIAKFESRIETAIAHWPE